MKKKRVLSLRYESDEMEDMGKVRMLAAMVCSS